MEVKDLIKSKVSLAPMAGITDFVLRSLIREYSNTCLITTEMISSEALTQVKDTDIVKRAENHTPISYQLSGHKPQMLADCAKYLQQYANMIDINMGCPVNKVTKGNDGAALMKTPELASELVRAIKENISKPVSVKFRLGFTADTMNYVEFGQKMQEAGASFITIHGRTRAQMYGGKADWKKIKTLVENVDIPVFANGDVISIETACDCLEQSNAYGVAVGRGALGDVTLIGRIEHFFKTGEKLAPPSIEEKIMALKKHLYSEMELRGELVGLKFVRKFYPYYINGIKNAAKYRSVLVTTENVKEIELILEHILKEEKYVV